MGEPLDRVARAPWPSSLMNATLANGSGAPDPSALDELTGRLQANQTDALPAVDSQYLLYESAGIYCTFPLVQLREVMNEVPRTIPLPNSPDWLLGIFPSRTEMLALVDPMPVLLGRLAATGTGAQPVNPLHDRARTAVLVLGAGERSLGIVVDLYGDTTAIPDHAMDLTSEGIAAAQPPILSRYVTAIYRPADVDRCYVALDAEHLLSDLISAIQEADEVYG